MDTKDWIALALVLLVCLFFMAAYFLKPPTPSTTAIVRIFCALLAGAAGMILAGTIAVQIQGQLSAGTNLAVQAGGAIALFVLVWFTYPVPPALTQGFNVSFPEGISFGRAARAIAEASKSSIDLRGFTAEEQGAVLEQLNVRAPNVEAALDQLRLMAPSGAIRPYRTSTVNGTLVLTIS